MTANGPNLPAHIPETRAPEQAARARSAGDCSPPNRSGVRESPSSTTSPEPYAAPLPLRRSHERAAERFLEPRAASLQHNLGETGVVGAIGGAEHQQVFARRETGEIEHELFPQRIDHPVRRLDGNPARSVERILAPA